MVFVEVARRQVLVIRNIDYFLPPFDGTVRTSKNKWEKGTCHGMEFFAKRRYEHEFKWKRSLKVEEANVRASVTKL